MSIIQHTTGNNNSKTITNRKAVTAKAKECKVLQVFNGRAKVLSPSGKRYMVTVSSHGASCTCDWAKYRPAHDTRSGCSHAQAAMKAIARTDGELVSFWTTLEDASRQKRATAYLGDGVFATYRSR